MNELLPSCGDDILDYFEGSGVYHHPWWDGFQHHIAARVFTTRELCLEVKRILDSQMLRMYLERGNDAVVRYFIRWFNGGRDTPYMIWIDESEEDGKRVFFYESILGAVHAFKVGAGMSVPENSLRDSQTAMPGATEEEKEHIHVQYEKCQLGGCGADSLHRISVESKGGGKTSLDVCDMHFKKIEEQRKVAADQKEKKRLERVKRNKLKPRVVRKKKPVTTFQAPLAP